MIPASFEYKRAGSIEEAIKLLDEDAQILGGGHSLIPALKLRLNAPGTLIDISKIAALKGITENDGFIAIGAGTSHADIAASEALATHCPMMPQAASEIGDIQVRNMGTIGGSIAHADPAADWPAVLIAANATVNIQGKNGSRSVSSDQFFTGFYDTALEEGEIITSIDIPKTGANRHSTYMKFKQPASRFALVGCAAAIELDRGQVKTASVALTGVGEYAYRAESVEKALANNALNADTIAAAASSDLTAGVDVMGDHYASETYRAHLASVFVKRALTSLI